MKCLITHGQDFGVGLLVATALAKMVTLGISMNFGFVGGVMFPSMFIGACAGTAAHLVVGDALPLLLSFSCMMVGVPAGVYYCSPSGVRPQKLTTRASLQRSAPCRSRWWRSGRTRWC